MRNQLRSRDCQVGGSTLIGLVLGICTGVLMLIKWPELAEHIEPHIRQFSASHLESAALAIGRNTQLRADNSLVDDGKVAGDFPIETEDRQVRNNFEKFDFYQSELANIAVESQKIKTPSVTLVVWDAFSTQSGARKFADAASERLGLVVDVVERAPSQFVPAVRCVEGTECAEVLDSINGVLSFEPAGGES
jgi:hypothetical protein